MHLGITFNTAGVPREIMRRLNVDRFGIKKLVCKDLLWGVQCLSSLSGEQMAGYVLFDRGTIEGSIGA